MYSRLLWSAIPSCLLTLVSFAQTVAVRDRVTAAVDIRNMSTVRDSTPALVARSKDAGRLPSDRNLGQMLLMLSPTREQNEALDRLVKELHTPSSPKFHRWLKPAEVGTRFGVSEFDATQVEQWLLSQGLKVDSVAKSRRFITFSGTVGQVEQAFHTEMHEFAYKGRTFIGNSTDIQIPAALRPVVRGVVRLSSTPKQASTKIVGQADYDPVKHQVTFSDGRHALTPADFATIYNLNALYKDGIDGTGQSFAIVARSDIRTRDVFSFMSLFGVPWKGFYYLVNGDDPGRVPGSDVEATLDITWASALAPGATPYLVISQSNFADGVDISAAFIVDNNIAPVMSTSFGLCEQDLGPIGNDFYYSLWAQAAAQGITAIVASGDNGGAGCDDPGSGLFAQRGFAVNGLASTPFNLAVGGTQFDDVSNPDQYWSPTNDPVTKASVLSYIPEKVWNESSIASNEVSLWAGGGGVSTLWSKPDWQVGAGVPSDGMRDLPDVSLTAAGHDGYVLCYGASCENNHMYIVGGTSASAPAFAALMTLVNQKTGSPQGNPNYVLYQLAAQHPEVFHDITTGDNRVPDQNGEFTIGYAAGPGFDLATGLGSVDAAALVNNWSSVQFSATTTTLTGPQLGAIFVHGSGVPFTAAVSAGGQIPTGNVAFFTTDNPIGTGTTLGVGSGRLDSTGTLNISLPGLPGGTHSVVARYGGDARFTASTSDPVTVTVTPETSQTTFVASVGGSIVTSAEAKYGVPLVLGIVVQGVSGIGHPTGSVAVNEGSTFIGSRLLNYGEHEGAAQGSSSLFGIYGFQVGIHLLAASYPGDASFHASTSPNLQLTITKSDAIPTFSVEGAALPNVPIRVFGGVSLPSGAVLPVSGTVAFTAVSANGSVNLGTVTLDPNSATFAGTFSFPSTGTWTVTAVYSGDQNVNPAQTARQVLVNSTEPTRITAASNAPVSPLGTPVTFRAQVSSDVLLLKPTGTVTFTDGATVLATVPLDQSGFATFTTSSLAGGSHSVTVAYSGDALFRSSSASLTQSISDYSLQALTSSLSIKFGQSGTASIAIVPMGGFNSPVTFTCSGLPSGAHCGFSPASITPNGTDIATGTMTVSTTAASAVRPAKSPLALVPLAGFGIAGFVLLVPRAGRSRKKALTALATIMLAAGSWGCGSSSGAQTPPNPTLGTYKVTVSASAAPSNVHTATVTVTIAQ